MNKREISLFIPDCEVKDERVHQIYKYCAKHNILLTQSYFKLSEIQEYDNSKNKERKTFFYFTIEGNTNTYDELISEFPDFGITETDVSKISNIADCDQSVVDKLKKCLNVIKEQHELIVESNKKIADIISENNDLEILYMIQELYGQYMTDFQKEMISNRITNILFFKEQDYYLLSTPQKQLLSELLGEKIKIPYNEPLIMTDPKRDIEELKFLSSMTEIVDEGDENHEK